MKIFRNPNVTDTGEYLICVPNWEKVDKNATGAKPCPKCGGTDIRIHTEMDPRFYLYCNDCKFSGPAEYLADYEEGVKNATSYWNKKVMKERKLALLDELLDDKITLDDLKRSLEK